MNQSPAQPPARVTRFSVRALLGRKSLFAGATLITTIALFYAVENWRGRRAWAECKRELEARGEKVDWEAFIPRPVPDDQNFLKAPGMEAWFSRTRKVTVVSSNSPNSFTLAVSPTTNLAQIKWPPVGGGIPITLDSITHLPKSIPDTIDVATIVFPFPIDDKPLTNTTFTNLSLVELVGTLADIAGLKVEWDASALKQQPDAKTRHRSYFSELLGDKVGSARQILDRILKQHLLAARWRPEQGVITIIPGKSITALRNWFDQYEPGFTILRDACQRPTAQWGGNYNHPYAVEIPNFVMLRSLAQALVSRANLNLALGNPDRAWEDLQLVLRLSNYTDSNATFVSAMIRVAVVGLCNDSIRQGVSAHLWPQKHLLLIQKAMSEIDLLQHAVDSLRAGHRAAVVRVIETLPTEFLSFEYLNAIFLRDSAKVTGLEARYSLTTRLVPQGWVHQNLAQFCRLTQGVIDAMDSNDQQIDPTKLDEVTRELELSKRWHRRPYSYLCIPTFPNLTKAFQATTHNQSVVKMNLLACALARFRLANGTYPTELRELTPGFIEAIPSDLFTGKPMSYHRTESGFLIWSLGWNGTDENGTSPGGTFVRDYSVGDWIWTMSPKPSSSNWSFE